MEQNAAIWDIVCVHIWQETANIGFAFQHHVTLGRTKSGKSSISVRRLSWSWDSVDMLERSSDTLTKFSGTPGVGINHLTKQLRFERPKTDLSGQIWSPFTYKNCRACRAYHQNLAFYTDSMHVQCGSIHPLTLMAAPPRPSALPSLPHAAQWWSGGGNNRHFVPLWHAKSVIGWQRTTFNNEIVTKKSEHYLYCLLTTACQIKMWNCNMQDTPWGQITHAYRLRLCHNSIFDTSLKLQSWH